MYTDNLYSNLSISLEDLYKPKNQKFIFKYDREILCT